MIPHEDYKEQRNLYTRNKSGVWKVVAYCQEPVVTMLNLITGEKLSLGVSGLATRDFEVIGKIPEGFNVLAQEEDV